MKNLFLLLLLFSFNACSSDIEKSRQYFHQAEKAKDKKTAINLYQKSCELGLATGCYNQYFLDKLNYKPLIRSCELNFGRGCLETGIYYEKMNDKEKSRKAYEKACNLDNAQACYNLAVISYKEYKDKEAINLFKKSCELGDTLACNALKKI